MNQKSIKNKVELVGIGLHKGVPVKMELEPLAEDSGIVFYRSDLDISIPLKPQNIVDTKMATVLGASKNGVQARVSTIEHLLSAIHAYGIDNIKISLDNEEVPIMDGSSIGHCILLEEAGIISQNKPKKAIAIKKPIEIKDGEKFVRMEPSDRTIFDFSIDFKHHAIQKQQYKFVFSTKAYKEEIARARTFGFLQEVNYLRSIGLAKGGDLSNCIVLDETSILNKEGLRFKNEFVRHKILDAIGDMALLGMPLLGTYIAFAGSHKLNHLLTEQILSDEKNYEIISLEQKQDSLEFDFALATQEQ